MRLFNSTAVLLLVLLAAPSGAQEPSATFTVFVQGSAIGNEDVTLTRSATGFTITTVGRLGPPFNIITRRLDIRYDADWKPLDLTLDAAVGGQPQRLHTTVQGTSAVSEISRGGETTTKTDTVSADTILLPTPFFGAYEALAARLSQTGAASTLHMYVAPQAELTVNVGGTFEERIQLPGRTMIAKRFEVTISGGPAPVAAQVWIDDHGRFLRLQVPAQSIDVLRRDIASVSARIEQTSHAGDEQVSINANGFSVAATVSKPASPGTQKLPAVVLVAGPAPVDRDEMTAGIPIFGQLAGALADAGFLVVRYDKRGVGQSGGRLESTTLSDYADDVRWVVKYLSDRKDVDDKRIAVMGYGEGGLAALLAAAKNDNIRALTLVAAPSTSGADLVLEQQRHALDRSKMSKAERDTAIDLQQKIIQAAVEGTGWEGIPPDVRRRVDTPYYRTFLLFNPAEVMKRVNQPLLIVHGELDWQIPTNSADQLAELARSRKSKAVVEVKKLPGLNHLLVPATTGEVDEYASLKDRTVSADVTSTLATWLQSVMTAKK